MSFFRNWFYLYLKQSPSEVVFERMICRLGEPYRIQYPFPSLRRVADFVIPGRKLVIEIDGASHEALAQRYKDLKTSIALEEMGWRVIRFTNDEVAQGLVIDPDLLETRATTRPTLGELRAALASLPEPLVKRPKRRARKRVPGPKKAP